MTINKKMIAFQTVDPEGDVWSNTAFLFYTHEEAEKFFSDPQLVLEIMGIELEEDEDLDTINYEVLKTDGPSKLVRGVSFSCEEGGDVKILEMFNGFVINHRWLR